MYMHPTELTLNEYVDGTLGRDERADVARHLETCGACRQLVEELREIARAAAALDPLTPPARVWTRIERELRTNPRGANRATASLHPSPSTGSYRWTWLAAAAVLLLAVFIGVQFRPTSSTVPDSVAGDSTAAEAIEAELKLAEEHYQKAISGLERIASETTAIDPDTAATLQKNLAVINQAIDESRAAVRDEPASERAQYSLIENFRTKLALLQDTVALITELRAGNEAAAARIVSGS
jgi:hypothetical protein